MKTKQDKKPGEQINIQAKCWNGIVNIVELGKGKKLNMDNWRKDVYDMNGFSLAILWHSLTQFWALYQSLMEFND